MGGGPSRSSPTADWSDTVYQDNFRPFLEELRKPVVTTMHTVLPRPSLSIRETVRGIAELSDEVSSWPPRRWACLPPTTG